MQLSFRSLLGILCAVTSAVPGFAGTLTRITWTSHKGTYINDTVTLSGTGLAADRIRVIADGAGLIADGTPDAFYLFNYTYAADVAAPKMTIVPAAAGLATIAWTPATPGFRLQESSRCCPQWGHENLK